jgi:hypothetical protein
MPTAPLVKIKAATAAEVCAAFSLDDEALPLLVERMTPRDFLEALLAHKQYVSGIDFLSHAFESRDAIWWGSLCLQQALGAQLTDKEKAAARAAVRWVFFPTEETRAAAGPSAEAAGSATPAGGLANAAFQTGGNVAPPKSPAVSPPSFAPAKAVALSVKLSSTKAEPTRISETQKLYLELGLSLAEGRCSYADLRGATAIRA